MSEIRNVTIMIRAKCLQCYGSGLVDIYDYFLEHQYGDMAEFEKGPCYSCNKNGYVTLQIELDQAEEWTQKKLKAFDWNFDYSDSIEVKRQARQELSLIKEVLEFLPEKISLSLCELV